MSEQNSIPFEQWQSLLGMIVGSRAFPIARGRVENVTKAADGVMIAITWNGRSMEWLIEHDFDRWCYITRDTWRGEQ